jgi:hypothetical protein
VKPVYSFVVLFACIQHFETDDKDLYRSKIKYIEENDPADLDITFVEEEYNSDGQLVKVY